MALKDVVGQDHITRLLMASIEDSHLAGAYLLTGNEGSGKRFLAYQFAKALNCAEGLGDSCNRCLPCRKIENGNHPDVKEISAGEASIKIDSIRELRDEINLKPFEGRWKVFIIPDAERLSLSASNSLLKTLEEPPTKSLIVLTAANPGQIIPTVQSRCQRLFFRPLDVEVMERVLVERWGFSSEEARSRAIVSGGSLGEGLRMDNGNVDRDRVIGLIKNPDLKGKAFSHASDLYGSKEECLHRLDLLASCYRDMLLLSRSPERSEGASNEEGEEESTFRANGGEYVVNVDIRPHLVEEARRLGQGTILQALSVIEDTKKQIRGNANVRLSLEVMLMLLDRVGAGV